MTDAQIVKLEQIDEALIRGILKAHSKTPKEFLYLETGCTPIRYILAQRRINYLNQILGRSDEELVKKILIAQQEKPTPGDFVQLVKKDLDMLGISYEEATQGTKKELKITANIVAFNVLKDMLKTHSKVKQIQYEVFEIQPYLKTNLITIKETNMLTALRSKCIRGIKCNFKKMFKQCVECPLKCETQNKYDDTQEHILSCKSLTGLTERTNTEIQFMYGTIEEQKVISKQFCILMRKREKLMEEQDAASTSSLPGAQFLDLSSQQQQQQGAAAVHTVQLQG